MKQPEFDPSLKEVIFYYSAEPNIYHDKDCTLYLSDEELQQVFAVLDANPDAKFADIPAELYKAFHDVVAEHCAEVGCQEFRLEPDMPESLVEYWKASKAH